MALSSLRPLPRFLLACSLALAACGPPPKPAPRPDTAADEPAPIPQWLFVTESGQGAKGARGECDKVRTWVVGEKSCTGELCEHGRDLGREWLRRCRKLQPDQVGELNELVEEASERVEKGADACIEQGKALLRTTDCGKAEQCAQQAQLWISRCGPRYATPLVVLMLTRVIERRYKEPTSVQFDVRSCTELGDLVQKAVACPSEEACTKPADAAAAFLERCTETPAPLATAFAIADVLVGASKGVDPIKTDPDIDKLEDNLALMTRDGRSKVVWTCGERAATVDAYVDARTKCSPGELILARLDASHAVRTVSVPHPSDVEFQRLYPFLEVRGEREARDRAEFASFQRRVREAIESGKDGNGVAGAWQLAAAMVPHAAAIARSAEYRKVLVDGDVFLAPAMREWGKRKSAAQGKVRDRIDAACFASRSLRQPLSDMRLDGSVLPGAFAQPAAMNLEAWMPSSFAAYTKELGKVEAALKKPLPDERVVDLRQRIRSDITACAASQAAISRAEQGAVTCLFKQADCNPAKAAELSAAADAERERLAQLQRSLALALAGSLFTPSEIQQFEAEKVAAGCLD